MLGVGYLMITGAGVAGDVAPPLIEGLAARFPSVLIVPTPNASRVVNLRDIARVNERLAAERAVAEPGKVAVQIVESYFDPAILPRPPHGLVLVAPCTFNSLNHLAAGLSPNLPLAIANEAIGRRTPVVIAIACNEPLWAHPAAPASAARLREWGCAVLDPVPVTTGTGVGLPSVEAILAAVDGALAGYTPVGER
jgi:3-polyprenyl-4-hydroxybenzoate decarboxylase